jgi:hypothetical protein
LQCAVKQQHQPSSTPQLSHLLFCRVGAGAGVVRHPGAGASLLQVPARHGATAPAALQREPPLVCVGGGSRLCGTCRAGGDAGHQRGAHTHEAAGGL